MLQEAGTFNLNPSSDAPNLQVENEETLEALSARTEALLDCIQQRFSFYGFGFQRLRFSSPLHLLLHSFILSAVTSLADKRMLRSLRAASFLYVSHSL